MERLYVPLCPDVSGALMPIHKQPLWQSAISVHRPRHTSHLRGVSLEPGAPVAVLGDCGPQSLCIREASVWDGRWLPSDSSVPLEMSSVKP